MRQLFSEQGLVALADLASHRTLYAFDFDGTLAPIVWHPPDARIGTALRLRLARLAARAPVAVISGRSLDDLCSRLPAEIVHRIGNHGNESAARPVPDSLRDACRSWIEQLRQPLAAFAGSQGIEVEDKGVTLSLHYRHARDRRMAATWLVRAAADLTPAARIIPGKMVLNLLPPGACTKFEALTALALEERVERVMFIGDDDTDEVVFAQAPPSWITVRVELDAGSRARYFLQNQPEVTLVLDHLLARMTTAGSAGDRLDHRTGVHGPD